MYWLIAGCLCALPDHVGEVLESRHERYLHRSLGTRHDLPHEDVGAAEGALGRPGMLPAPQIGTEVSPAALAAGHGGLECCRRYRPLDRLHDRSQLEHGRIRSRRRPRVKELLLTS